MSERKTIYKALFRKSLELTKIRISRSNFLPDELTDKGYCSISRVNDLNNTYDTAGKRREIHLYKFDIYTLGLRGEYNIEDIITEIINKYDKQHLDIYPLVFEGCFYNGDFIREEESGIWHGIIIFEIWTQRSLAGVNNG